MNDGYRLFSIKRLAVFCITASAFFLLTCHASADKDDTGDGNLIENPSFEIGTDRSTDIPDMWFAHVYDGNPNTTSFLLSSLSHTGNHCAMIENIRYNDARLVQSIKVSENKTYRLSCWILAENVSDEGKGANLSILNSLTTSDQIKGTSNRWEYVEIYAHIGGGIDSIDITVGIGGYSGESTGKASFDDVAAEEVSVVPVGAIVTEIRREADSGGGTASNDIPGSDSLMVYLVLVSASLAFASLYFIKSDVVAECATSIWNIDETMLFDNDTENDL